MKRPRLSIVEALLRQRLKLTFMDGGVHTVSLAKGIEHLPGLAPRTISAYGTGSRSVPRHIALA